jgi:DNA-binding CsgD family transcriptional regulator
MYLTELERRYADMLKDGLSYPEIAGKEVVARPTVKNNVQRLYRKLGINNREELARVLRDWRL